ncbi:uncharacterized protein VTP21DRAFT_10847 [Calcarisporiella thermophila]|uniref:uncharacterized protein n=1 Tax=Calcarisporiella thermophila TaxID=911321 RepID=UPI0037442D30
MRRWIFAISSKASFVQDFAVLSLISAVEDCVLSPLFYSTNTSRSISIMSRNQVIVVGGGLSGLSAAHTVLERGGKVVVLDKNPFFGGNSTKATSGINGALTKTQVSLGIQDSAEAFYQDTAKSAREELRPELARVLTGNSASAVEWLQSKFQLDLSLVSRLGGHSFPRTHRGKEKFPGMTITYALMEALEDLVKSAPDRVKLVKRARVTRLVKENGAVVGVEYQMVAKDGQLEGQVFREYGPVILATGGYAADFTGDASLLKKYRPEIYDLPTTNGDHCTGDGIKMAMEIGGSTVNLDKVQVHPTGLIDPKEPNAKVKFLAAEALRGCGGLLLNAEGERFCDELGHRDYVTGMMWKQRFPIRLVLNTAAAKEIEWHCKHYVGRGLMRRFANGDELAKELGISAEKLRKTFDDYNDIAAGKKPDPWGKKYFHNVPIRMEDDFHVALMQPVLHYTMGGVEIDPSSAILDSTGRPIPGLYACGEMAGGVHGANRLGGSSLLGCVVFGRVAGESAARFLSSQPPAETALASSAQQRLSNLAGHVGGGNLITTSISQPGGVETRVQVDPQSRRVQMEITWADGQQPSQPYPSSASAPAVQAAPLPPAQQLGTVPAQPGASAAEEPANNDPNRAISAEEVAKHNKEDDCWVIINGRVLDVTKFLPDHPGGKRAILIYAGRDATEEFNMLHKPDVIEKYAPEAIIGVLKSGSSAPQAAEPNSLVPVTTPSSGATKDARKIMKMTPSNVESRTSGGTADVLKQERATATFAVDKMTNLLDGGEEKTKRRRFILSPLVKASAAGKHDLDRADAFKAHLKHFIGVHEKFWESFIPTREDVAWMSEYSMFQGTMMNHYGLFLYTVLSMGNPKQVQWFLKRSIQMEIVGAYAQTELGHGSNVRGLMTIAEYDKNTKEFIINTPTLRSIKWWPGSLGKVATHAMVYAQLLIDGKEYGVHPFVVQIRDENHHPLPGIELGDLGPKLGDHANDTGYMVMTDVRIPREFMMGRYAEVSNDGRYISRQSGKKEANKVVYATMISARASMVKSSSAALSKAVTIAIRYSAIRTQGFSEPGGTNRSYKDPETKVIDYQVQRFRLFKQLALCYAMKVSGSLVIKEMEMVESQDDRTMDMDALQHLLATSAGLKALCTYLAWQGVEDVRKCCGGNGYLMDSGIAPIAADYVWQTTAEGDWIILMLQTARFLVDCVRDARQGKKISGVASYISKVGNQRPRVGDQKAFLDLAYLRELYEHCALTHVTEAASGYEQSLQESNGHIYKALNAHALQMCTAVRAHTFLFFLDNFIREIEPVEDVSLRAVLTRICLYFALSHLVDDSLFNGQLSTEELRHARRALVLVGDDLRPDAVSLVDAFDIPDNVLNSTIGRYDGNIYEALYEAAARSKLNEVDPFDGYNELLRPYLDIEFLKLRNKVPPSPDDDDDDDDADDAEGGEDKKNAKL